MPSQNATDVYRLTSGFAPCAVDQLDCTLFQPSNANLIYYPSHLISGDMAVNPGRDDGILSGDTWWFPQVSRGLPTSKTSNGCHVPGFWLEMVPSSQQPVHDCAWDSKEGTLQFIMGVSQNPAVNQQSHQLNRSPWGGNMRQLSTSGQTIMYSIFIRSQRIFEWLFVFQMKAQVVRRVKKKIRMQSTLWTDAFIKRCLYNFDRPNCGH